MTNEIVLNGKAIALMSVGINNQLNTKQQALLKLLHECLKKNKPLNWDLMVKFFVENVDSTGCDYNYDTKEYVYFDIMKSYKNYDDDWIYGTRTRIRQWFANNMGSMILKGSILALPVIEIN